MSIGQVQMRAHEHVNTSNLNIIQFTVEYYLKMIYSEDYEIVNGKFSKIEN